MIKYVIDSIKWLSERKNFELLKDFIELIKKHKSFFKKIGWLIIIIPTFLILGEIVRYKIYVYPSWAIDRYINGINKRDYESSWKYLTKERKKKKFNNKISALKNSYETTNQIEKIDYQIKTTMSFFELLRYSSRTYTFEYEVIDKLDNNQLALSGRQKWNTLWLMLINKKYSVSDLKKLGNNHFRFSRIYKQKFIVVKEDGIWKISDVENISIRINM